MRGGKRVLVAMSGGVDSSVCAALLLRAGYDVAGFTFTTAQEGASDEKNVKDAAAVCRALSIPHQSGDYSELFAREVVTPFIESYAAGRTPNPCVLCNRAVKFGALFHHAMISGFDYIATGHYALCGFDDSLGCYAIRRSPNKKKDQSYVLYTLSQEVLSRLLLPLGPYRKEEVRAMAGELSLPVSKKADSQEICFIPGDDYGAFIEKHSAAPFAPGPIVDRAGNRIGTHRGIIHYTVGQRKGLGSFGRPMFVLKVDASSNTLVLGEGGEEFSSALYASCLFASIPGAFDGPRRAQAKIRYGAEPAPCLVTPLEEGRVRVEFDTPQRAVTPGQAVVFYDADLLLGGATID